MDNPSFMVLMYKLGTLFSGVFISYLGFRLFQKGVGGFAGDLKLAANQKTLTLKNAAPGTFFCLLGACIIIVSLYQGFSVEQQHLKNEGSNPGVIMEKPELK